MQTTTDHLRVSFCWHKPMAMHTCWGSSSCISNCTTVAAYSLTKDKHCGLMPSGRWLQMSSNALWMAACKPLHHWLNNKHFREVVTATDVSEIYFHNIFDIKISTLLDSYSNVHLHIFRIVLNLKKWCYEFSGWSSPSATPSLLKSLILTCCNYSIVQNLTTLLISSKSFWMLAGFTLTYEQGYFCLAVTATLTSVLFSPMMLSTVPTTSSHTWHCMLESTLNSSFFWLSWVSWILTASGGSCLTPVALSSACWVYSGLVQSSSISHTTPGSCVESMR